MIVATVATTIIVATMGIVEVTNYFVPVNRWMYSIFLFGSPIWVAGHVCIFAGGAKVNRGDMRRGLLWIRVACVLIVLPMAAISRFFYFAAVFGPWNSEWSVGIFVFSLPIYLTTLIALFISTFFLRAHKR